jgi:hypothetical protein
MEFWAAHVSPKIDQVYETIYQSEYCGHEEGPSPFGTEQGTFVLYVARRMERFLKSF